MIEEHVLESDLYVDLLSNRHLPRRVRALIDHLVASFDTSHA